MRRSAAPSVISSKRARFLSPLAKHSNIASDADIADTPTSVKRNALQILDLINNPQASTNSKAEEESKSADLTADPEHISPCTASPILLPQPVKISVKPLISKSSSSSNQLPVIQPPIISATPHTSGTTQGVTNLTPNDSARYFNVMWCKLSRKKHKKWEGDAILVVKGRSTRLLDLDGKEIGKSTGHKLADLNTLSDGESLVIGGKEIEVMSTLNEAEFLSGKCFCDSGAINEELIPKKPITVSKKFLNPLRDTDNKQQTATFRSKAQVLTKPRHNPSAPDALVMPRPTQSQQYKHNISQHPIIDVVIDPHLGRHLRPHQREGVTFLYASVVGIRHNGTGAILADEMGLGKTLQSITLIWTLLKQGPYGGLPVIKKALIITPGSLVKNWQKEFKKWLGVERIQVYAVSTENRLQDFLCSSVYKILIISYEMYVRNTDVLNPVNFDIVICDEGHRLKNSNIKTSSLLSGLTTRRRIILSGTPLQNDLLELYSLADFCNPDILGTSSAFRNVYEHPIVLSRQPQATPAQKDLGQSRAEELNRVTDAFILRRTQDTIAKYLPPKAVSVFFCRPSPLQMALYKHLLKSQIISSCITSMRPIEPAHYLMCIGVLKKLCNHPRLLQDVSEEDLEHQNSACNLVSHLTDVYPEGFWQGSPLVEHGGKLLTLDMMLKQFHQANQKVVVVSHYTQTLDLLQGLCESYNYNFVRLDGKTATTKRQGLVDNFNAKHSMNFVFLLSSKAGGVGLNLVGASRLVLYDIDWNPANDLQAMARVWRDGQRNKVFIYRLITTGSIEEKIYQRQICKQGLSATVVDSRSTKNQQAFSQQDLKDLFSFSSTTLCSTHDLLNCKQCYSTNATEGDAVCEPKGQSADTLVTECKGQRPFSLHGTAISQPHIKKNLQMDELLSWKHYRGPNLNFSEVDPLLNDVQLSSVSFAFSTETDT